MAGDDADYEENAAQLEALADEAPDEIEDAMATISDGYDEMAEALQGHRPRRIRRRSPILTCSRPSQDLEPVFDEEYEEASQTVSDYVTENCSGELTLSRLWRRPSRPSPGGVTARRS